MRVRKNIQSRVFHSFAEAERAELEYWKSLSPAQRLEMMWQLTLDAWAFAGGTIAESRLPRHIVHIYRRER
jgi:hypothetical protein